VCLENVDVEINNQLVYFSHVFISLFLSGIVSFSYASVYNTSHWASIIEVWVDRTRFVVDKRGVGASLRAVCVSFVVLPPICYV
jgi:hypothetical protein